MDLLGGGTRATLVARLLAPFPVNRILTNEVDESGNATRWILPNTVGGPEYLADGLPTGGLNFPYGYPVETDEQA